MDQAHYDKVRAARRRLDIMQAKLDETRKELHAAIFDSFPETHGQPAVRGVLAELARASGYTREHVMDIRDGVIACPYPKASSSTSI